MITGMEAVPIDERVVRSARTAAAFVVFFYDGGSGATEHDTVSWSVDSRLLSGADLGEALTWVSENLPASACWSLAVVDGQVPATPPTELRLTWIVGADVLNIPPAARSPEQARIAAAMVGRRVAWG